MADDKPKIGFVGLGNMGQAMTKRLASVGYAVTGYDVVEEKIERATGHGVRPARSAAEVARASDVVLVCVMTKADLEAAVFGEGGIAEGGAVGKILIDHGTTEIPITKAFAERLKTEAGMGWVDAPVSGGPPASEAGTLAIMAGGDDGDVARVREVMAELGQFTQMGPVGAGQVTKMVNQVLVLTNYCVLAEALTLAEAGGVDASKIPEALASGYAGSNILKGLYPRMVKRDFTPAGYAFQVLKDLDMVQGLAKELEVPTPMAAQASSLFRILNAKGHSQLDGIAVLKLYDPGDHV